jgi:hypothetical protein
MGKAADYWLPSVADKMTISFLFGYQLVYVFEAIIFRDVLTFSHPHLTAVGPGQNRTLWQPSDGHGRVDYAGELELGPHSWLHDGLVGKCFAKAMIGFENLSLATRLNDAEMTQTDRRPQ